MQLEDTDLGVRWTLLFKHMLLTLSEPQLFHLGNGESRLYSGLS